MLRLVVTNRPCLSNRRTVFRQIIRRLCAQLRNKKVYNMLFYSRLRDDSPLSVCSVSSKNIGGSRRWTSWLANGKARIMIRWRVALATCVGIFDFRRFFWLDFTSGNEGQAAIEQRSEVFGIREFRGRKELPQGIDAHQKFWKNFVEEEIFCGRGAWFW